MKHYRVVFSQEAVADLSTSYEWGCEAWGEESAWRWYASVRDSILRMLGTFPESQPIAPDNDEYDVEARQMIVSRYRVIFTIAGRVVTVLHFRGPYTGYDN